MTCNVSVECKVAYLSDFIEYLYSSFSEKQSVIQEIATRLKNYIDQGYNNVIC